MGWRGRWSAVVVIAVVSAVALALASIASAQMVFDVGNDIWASNDDGSGAHLLVTAASLGMDQGLGDPAVAPHGSTLLFDGSTHANPFVDPLSSSVFYGDNAAGVYALSGGTVTRLSGPPRSTGTASESDELVPEPASGGVYVYEHEECVPQTTYYNLPGKYCGGWLRYAPISSGAAEASAFATECDGDMGIPSTPPADPSPDPASGSLRVAYVGCEQAEQDQAGITTDHDQLIVSGPGGQGKVTVALAPGASNAASGDPDMADPSWSPDGSELVVYNAGGTDFDPQTSQTTTTPGGLYVFSDLTQTNAGRLVLEDPLNGDGTADRIRSPRFTGAGTIVFVLDGSIYSIPASCSDCTMASATKLRDGGTDASTQSFSVGWTSGSVAPAKAGSGGGGSGGSGGGGGSGGSGGTGGSSGGGGGHGLRLTVARVRAPRLQTLLAHGLTVRARCSLSCRLSLTLTLPAATAHRYGLISARAFRRLRHRRNARVTIGHAAARLRAGRSRAVRVKLNARARRGLRHARRLTLGLRVVARAGHSTRIVNRSVRVRA